MTDITISTARTTEAPPTIATDQDGMPMWAYAGWLVEALTERGERYIYGLGALRIEDATRLVGRVEARGTINDEHWFAGSPVYGSVAYQEDGGEEELLAFERDASDFPNLIPLSLT